MKLLGLPWALLLCSAALLQPPPGALLPGVAPEPGLGKSKTQAPAPGGTPAPAAGAPAKSANSTHAITPHGATSNASHAKTPNASHAKTSTLAPAWSAQSLLQTLHPDARGTAQLAGLAHHPELNGRTVQVMGQDKPSGLVIVQLQGGRAFKVAAAHLMNRTAEEPNAKIVGMVKDQSLNGLPVQVLGFDKQSGRFVVKLPDGSMRKVTEEHLASPQQESAQDQAPEEATLTGMTKDTSLNGQVVQVLAFDEKSGRYVVKLPDGSERKVKKDHLAEAPGQDVARLVGMTKDRSLNGQEVHVLGFDKESNRYVVELPDGSKRKVLEEHLEDVGQPHQEEHGQEARLTGMTKDKSLNGQLVKVLGVDKDSGRFVVKLADGKMKKVTESHLKDVDNAGTPGAAPAPAEVSAILERPGGKAERVEVLGFDSESSRFLVANGSGTETLADLDALEGLTNVTERSLTRMVIAGKNAAPLPQLTICNTYPSRAGLTVVLRHTPNHTDDLLVGSNLPFSTCRDLEFPVARGTLVFLRGRMQVGEYPFLVKPKPTREILLVHRADKDSEGCAVMRSVVQAKPKPGQVIVMNAASGFDLIGLAATFGGAHHPLRFNQLYDLQPGHYDLSLTAPNTRLAAGLDVSAGKTYVVAATGVAQGLHGEPTPVGLFIHGVDSFDVAEASPVTSTPRPHSLPPQAFLQVHSAAALAATLLLLGLLES